METSFSTDCNACPRLADFLGQVRIEQPDYFAKPVPPFGDPEAKLIIVGLAPGMHGANRTGRPFTGDHAGILLYQTLFKFGFANQPDALAIDDGLQLINCRITNAVKCLPPGNKPIGEEIKTCNQFLKQELQATTKGTLMLALGTVAHQSVLRAFDLKLSGYKFSHGGLHDMPGDRQLLDSYHCSRYNTSTKRLTAPMFEDVFAKAKKILASK